jgi:alkyl hydroperoxide reductase subunit AhpC
MTTTPAVPETAPAARIPLIGETAPAFKAHTTQGPINFPKDYEGKWVILFSHPADFTPVCTTEFMTFATMQPEFKALNCELVGLSIDSHYAHIAWLRTIKEKIKYKNMANVEVTFPLIADVKMEVAKAYGMVQPGASDTQAVRAVFFIDSKATIPVLPAVERAQFPGNQAAVDRAANHRQIRLRHARRLAARRRRHRAAARLLRHGQRAHGETGPGRLRARLVYDVQEAPQSQTACAGMK